MGLCSLQDDFRLKGVLSNIARGGAYAYDAFLSHSIAEVAVSVTCLGKDP